MLRLFEHQRSEPVFLTAGQIQVLADTFKATFEPGSNGRVVVIPGYRIGALVVDGLQVSVEPKLPVRQLLRLIAEAADPFGWLDVEVRSLPNFSLHDAVAALFARACLQTFQKGLLRSYHRENQSLAFVRGRVHYQRYVSSPQALPIPVVADVFDDDILENQILRAALLRLRLTPDLSEATRTAVSRALQTVKHVQHLREPLKSAEDVIWTRQNTHYKSVLTLARLVLQGGALTAGLSSAQHSGFVIDMPRLIEDWVRMQLRAEWGLAPTEMRDSWGGRLWLDDGKRVPLIPNLGVMANGMWQFVGDVKYKILGVAGARREDVYQMLAYLTATGLKVGTLVYVGVEGLDETLYLPHHDQSIRVVSINLASENPRASLVAKLSATRHVTCSTF